MGYREQQGVRVRVELGPRDVHKAQAWLAITTTPGVVAKKSIHQAGLPSTCPIASYLADNLADNLAVKGPFLLPSVHSACVNALQ